MNLATVILLAHRDVVDGVASEVLFDRIANAAKAVELPETERGDWAGLCGGIAKRTGFWFTVTPGEKPGVAFMHPQLGTVFKSREFSPIFSSGCIGELVLRDIALGAVNFLREVEFFARTNMKGA